MYTRFQPLSRWPRDVTKALRAVLVVACVTALASCGGKAASLPQSDQSDQSPVTALLTAPSPKATAKNAPEVVPKDVPKMATEKTPKNVAENAPNTATDAPPPALPMLGIMTGDDADTAHNVLAGSTYRQTIWASAPPVLRRRYESRNPENPLQWVELETCQSDDRVVTVRVGGSNARAVYEAAHHKFDFRFVERSRDVAGMDPGPGPDMPFSRRFAEDVVLTLTTTPDGAELRLQSEPLHKLCAETVGKARQHMQDYFLEQDQARATRNRDSL